MIKNLKEPYGESARGRQIKIKNYSAGITLIEIVVVIFIIALFSTILIVNFPEIQRRMALSRSTYKLAQDLRRTLDLSLSGVPLKDIDREPITVKGYGIYINLEDSTQYVIYADVADGDGVNDQKYSGDTSYPLCAEVDQTEAMLFTDCAVEIIDVSKENPSLYIRRINNIDYPLNDFTSINFSPPNPVINITNRQIGPQIGIVLGVLGSSAERTVSINTSGAINVQ